MSWELKNKLDIVIGILHTQTVDANMLLSTLMLDRPGWKTQVFFESGRPYDVSRNNIATRALELGAEWCFFYDSDLLIPPNTITRLASHNMPIVGGLYDRRHPEITPSVYRDIGKGVLAPIPKKEIDAQIPFNTLIEVGAIGAGCLLIHRKVFEVLKDKVLFQNFNIIGPPPSTMHFYDFFHWGIGRGQIDIEKEAKEKFKTETPTPEQIKKVSEETHPGYSEDLTFCVLARKYGFKIFVDTTIKCTHIAHMGIIDGQIRWLPLEGG